MDRELTIGEVARRTGLSVPTVRYYESRGLLSARRTPGNQRRYDRSVLRRLAVVTAAARVGLPLAEVAAAFAELPADRAPDRADWFRLSAGWRRRVDERIAELEALRGNLDGCIGCGCLSLDRCALFNPGDEATAEGTESRWVRRARSAAATPGRRAP
ncbi:MerR family transcriptional regulator, redox-sensitive transcriptional activator SoxR [Modestobacter sp. DSM 44400]|uniref:redox-sensitive transcriptional activator SoxR n=1 Tax=Modestobacter sp. DSM 44400 TaxID=1550230 RepID=UPI0008976A73|nr:redox-sensitive transcriptional activator SoxR [Modestobacter sp. DSM 44400]SDX83440.1 MerR family transcriptional regulator, redox-sensitive transcriptional activator SoxR [Modestobacter sp. DSM 44400]